MRANLLNAPAPIVSCLVGLAVASLVDRYKFFSLAIMFSAVWTIAGLIALYVSRLGALKSTIMLIIDLSIFQ